MIFEHIPFKKNHWGGMEYTYQELSVESVEDCMDAHSANVTKQPGTSDPNCPEHICVALREQRKIIARIQSDY